MKFLCDVMLIRLGRWLRAAGYDTKMADHASSDRELVQQAQQENRILLTRDRKLLEIRHAAETTRYLNCNDTEQCLQVLTQQCHINWLLNPFSRCMECNTPLENAQAHQLVDVPESSRKHIDKLLYCPTCQKLYWEGSHVKRMYQRLQNWQNKYY